MMDKPAVAGYHYKSIFAGIVKTRPHCIHSYHPNSIGNDITHVSHGICTYHGLRKGDVFYLVRAGISFKRLRPTWSLQEYNGLWIQEILTQGHMESQAATTIGNREFTMERIISAKRDVVWEAWTQPQYLALWWGPKGFTSTVDQMEVKPGGQIRIDMQGPDGKMHHMSGAYREIVKPEWIVFSTAATDHAGNTLSEVLNMVQFDGENNHTRITIKVMVSHNQPGNTVYLGGIEEGWRQSIDRLQQAIKNLEI